MAIRTVIYPFISNNAHGIERPYAGDYSNDDKATSTGNIISDYDGPATEEDLPDYIEPPAEPEYQTLSIRKTQWRSLFEFSEQILSDKVRDDINGDLSFLVLVNDGDTLDSPHPLIPSVTYRDILRTGFASFGDTNTIDVTDSTTVIMVNTFYLVGILPSQERVDTILKGVPQ